MTVKRSGKKARWADLPSALRRRSPRTPGESVSAEPRTAEPSESPELPAAEPQEAAEPTELTPREWNLWELERRARDYAGDAARDEEWTALFVHLRQFADTEGQLPEEFDGLVRESFSELIQAA